jgi:hypothetical protein
MNRRTLLAIALLGAALPLARPAAAANLTVATGTVIGFSAQDQVLRVNTRLGALSLLVTSDTLVLLNNHTATNTDIRAGDKVTVEYRFDTREVKLVHLVRQQRRTGRIVDVTATAVVLRVDGANLSLRTDTQSLVELEEIPLTTRSVLIGRQATAVFEPGSLLLLSLNGESELVTAPLTAVDATARTVTLGGRRPRTLTLDSAATLLRNGTTTTIASLVTGDRVTVAFIRQGTVLRGLALTARGSTGTSTAK